MRVIAGLYKGRTLTTVKDLSVRPATDRVKQTIFDMLAVRMPFAGATVLDLFAGSGGLGIEALSRGAGHVTFVESSRQATQSIERNLKSLGCEDKAEVLDVDAMYFIQTAPNSFDLIFADPPYDFEVTADLPHEILAHGLLHPQGHLLIEHAKNLQFQGSDQFRIGPQKRFGRTCVTFFQGTQAKD